MKYLIVSLSLITCITQANTFRMISNEVAYSYCKKEKKSLIVLIWPRAQGKDKEIKQLLNLYGSIKYHTKVYFSSEQAHYVLGREHPFVTNISEHVKHYFPTYEKPVHLFIWKCPNTVTAVTCKTEIRKLFNIGYVSIHITDHHEGTVKLARYLLR